MSVTIVQALSMEFTKVSDELARDRNELSDYDIGFEEGYLGGLMLAINLVREIVEGNK